MTKFTAPDANQDDIVQALHVCGFRVVDMHNVPSATEDAALAGLPDLMAVDERGLTLIGDFDKHQVRQLLEAAGIAGLRIVKGAIILPEVKTPDGKLRAAQIAWHHDLGIEPLVFRAWDEVLKFCGRESVSSKPMGEW